MKTPRQKLQKKLPLERIAFSEHLSELRTRLLYWLATFLLGSLLGYIFREQIISILLQPLNQPIYYDSPAGGINFILQITFFIGFLVSLPLLIFQVLKFVEPAFPKALPTYISVLFLSSTILLIIGICFAYFISLPATLYFLNKFTIEGVNPLISTTAYINFVTHYIIGFGIVFQLPIILLAINLLHPLTLSQLFQFERWVIVISFILAAILTPTPDILNQLMMAVPLILLYQISLILVWIFNKRSRIS